MLHKGQGTRAEVCSSRRFSTFSVLTFLHASVRTKAIKNPHLYYKITFHHFKGI